MGWAVAVVALHLLYLFQHLFYSRQRKGVVFIAAVCRGVGKVDWDGVGCCCCCCYMGKTTARLAGLGEMGGGVFTVSQGAVDEMRVCSEDSP